MSLRRLQLLQGTLGVLHPGGAALVLPPGALSGGIHGGGAGQRRRVLSPVRLRGRGDADGAHGAAARRERERLPLHGARDGAADRTAVREGVVGGRRGADARRDGGRPDGRTCSTARTATVPLPRRPPARTGSPVDLRALIKVGALDSIAGGWTRPMMLWLVDSTAECVRDPADRPGDWFDHLPAHRPRPPRLRPRAPPPGGVRGPRLHHRRPPHGRSTPTRSRRFRLCPSTELHRHVGRHVLPPGCSPPPSRCTP